MPCFAAWALWCLGRSDEAVNQIDQALALARELGEPQGLAHAFFFASGLYQMRGDHMMAQQYAEAAIETSAQHGLVMYQAMASAMHGWTLSEQDHVDEGIDEIRDAIAAIDATSTALVRPHFLALLALALSKDNRTDEALQALNDAIIMVLGKGERYYEAELYRLKGELLVGRDDAEAEECFRTSLEIAESQKAKEWQLRTEKSLARLLVRQGKQHE